MNEEPADRRIEAEGIYAAALGAGVEVDVDALCAAHPDIQSELRQLHETSRQVRGVLEKFVASGSLLERIRSQFGEDAYAHVSLEPEGGRDAGFSTGVFERLTGRHGFERYRMKGEVARGGQGSILRVWDEDLRRNLAMKVTLFGPEAGSSAGRDVDTRRLGRFLEEAQVTGQNDVAVSDGREIGPDGRCKTPVGNTVDINNATFTNTIGDALMAAYWKDPAFDPSQRAFYYVRVLEIPTPTWLAYDRKALGVALPEEALAKPNKWLKHQERAYTSPIWYTP